MKKNAAPQYIEDLESRVNAKLDTLVRLQRAGQAPNSRITPVKAVKADSDAASSNTTTTHFRR